MKKIAVALFILASFTIHAAGKSSTSVKITGVKGDVLTNVQKRLDELKELTRKYQKAVDKAAKSGWLKRNVANRKKSRLAKKTKKVEKK